MSKSLKANLKKSQTQWMQERNLSLATAPKTRTQNYTRSAEKPNKKQPMMWSGSSNEEFVVRRPLSSSRSMQSNRSSISSIGPTPHSKTPSLSKDKQVIKTPSKQNKQNTTHISDSEEEDDELNSSLNLSNKIESFLSTLETSGSNSKSFNNNNTLYQTANEESINSESSEYLSNHYCVSCKNLMVGKQHCPQIVFPCGHSFCSSCLERCQKCLNCGVEISAIQSNTALQTVIQHYIEQKKKKIEEKKTQKLNNCKMEMENVETRIITMKSEASSIIDSMEYITHNLLQERDDIDNIKDTGNSIKTQIEKLHQKLKECEEKHFIKIDNCKDLETSYEQKKKQLLLVEKTLQSLKKNKDAIKTMIVELHPGYQSDSSEDD